MKKKLLFSFLFTFMFLPPLVYISQHVGGNTPHGQKIYTSTANAAKKEKESVYERMMRTKKIRCGYVTWGPMFIKDPNTLSMLLEEDKLRQVMNTVINELLNSGAIDHIIDKYEKHPKSLYRVAKPYVVTA